MMSLKKKYNKEAIHKVRTFGRVEPKAYISVQGEGESAIKRTYAYQKNDMYLSKGKLSSLFSDV